MTAAQIEQVARGAWRDVAPVLTDAFAEDPIFSWIVPAAAARKRATQGHFAIECRDIALRHGRSLAVRDGGLVVAAALVLPPGEWRMPARVQLVSGPAYTRAFGHRLPWAAALGARIEARHPREPHVYLPYIGTLRHAQGRGLGAALLAKIAGQCDHDGHAAYLEASSPRSAPLYRRFGFETREIIRPFGSPPIELMWRDPR